MISEDKMTPVLPKQPKGIIPSDYALTGIPIPKPLRVSIFSPEEWETFTEEWATTLEDLYSSVRRFTGAGDKGIDIAGFLTDESWKGGWDNYQCKQYNHALHPSDVWVELGKIVYYSYKGEYPPPRKYYFVAPKGIGTTLQKLLVNPEKLKTELSSNWKTYCETEITSTATVVLEGDLLKWFNKFDFTIFSSKSAVELITAHAKTAFHAVRFGGGLPARPEVLLPPDEPNDSESRYIQQLFNAYGSHLKVSVKEASELLTCAKPKLQEDFLRQRERFYHAESLRNFARDNVPEGTFQNLQDEVYHGVIDTCENEYADGFGRMRATIIQAGNISEVSNPLKSVIQIQDRQGICHQLANDDKLIWVSEEKG